MKTLMITILVTLQIHGISNNEGNILIMGNSNSLEKPIMLMEKAIKGDMTVEISIPDNIKNIELSVMHDENGNYKMDMTEEGVPAEGYALKKIKVSEKGNEYSVRLSYPNTK